MGGQDQKPFDFEMRTFEFAKQVRVFVKRLPRTICNIEDVKQLVRSSGSVGANYIEANENLGKNDLKLRMRIARKEAKESRYWLRLLDTGSSNEVDAQRQELVNECGELLKILSAMLTKIDRGM
jgi:four helix bundle protein